MKDVILITEVRFWEQGSGNRARISALILYLSEKVRLTVVAVGPTYGVNEAYLSEQYNVSIIILEKNRILSSSGYLKKLERLIKLKKFDAVIIEYIYGTFYLSLFDETVKKILDVHDIINLRSEEFKRYNLQGRVYELTKELEYQLFEFYSTIIVLCEPDYEILRNDLKDKNIILCPHPSNLKYQKIRKEVTNVCFIGSNYQPNSDGINSFIECCWPIISDTHNVTLTVFGTVCNSVSLKGQKQILLKGIVEDLNEIYSYADIIINPVRFGSGLKIKTVEALASGLPLVSTSHSVRGFEKLQGKGFLVANTTAEFCSTISSLICDFKTRKSLGKSAYTFIQENYSQDACFAPLLGAIYK